jgi:hypothetical protein
MGSAWSQRVRSGSGLREAGLRVLSRQACQYAMEEFEPEVLKSVLAAHQMLIADTPPGSHHCSIHFRNEGWSAELVAES